MKNMSIKKKWVIVLSIQIVLIAAALLRALHDVRSLRSPDINIMDWTCPYSVYHDGAFTVEENLYNSGTETTFLYGPGASLKKGSYVAVIQYEAEFDQSCMATGTNVITHEIVPAEFIHASRGILSASKSSINYKFEVPEDVNKFYLSVNYDGRGFFQVKNINILPTATYYRRSCASLILIFAGIDLLILLSGCGEKKKKTLWFILGLSFAASIPLFFRQVGIYTGDMEFHLIRIDAVANAIRDRQFPPRISSLWMDGYGFPVSIYYNDILLCFPAILRLLGFDLHFSLKAYILAVNLLTAAIAYWSFIRLFDNKRTAKLVTLSYVLAPFRLGDMYIHRALGEFTAMMFLPLIAYAVVKIYTEDPENWKQYQKYGLILSLGISGIIASHLISLVLTAFFLLLVCLFFIRKTIRKNTLRVWIGAVFTVLLLNAYYLVPFFDYKFNVTTLLDQNAAVRGSGMIQNYGISLGRLLAFYPSAFTEIESMPYTPGLLLMLAFAYGCWRCCQVRDRKLLYLLFFSGIALFLTMDCFPWNFLEMHSLFFSFLTQIQYPSRFLMICVILLCLVLGELCNRIESEKNIYRTKIDFGIILLNFVFLIFFVSDYSVGWKAENKYETESLNTFATSLHFLPAGASTNRYDYSKDILMHGVKASILSRKTHTMVVHAESSDGGTIEIPVLNYKYYQASDSSGNEFEIRNGTNYRICFDLPAGFSNEITISFRAPWYWRAAIFLSLLSWVPFFFALKFYRRTKYA